MTLKSWAGCVVGLGMSLLASRAAALTVTVTIHELEIADADFDAGYPIFPDLIQYQPIIGDFYSRPTTRVGNWDSAVRVCPDYSVPDCARFVRSPNWVFSTEVEPNVTSMLFRFSVIDVVNDTSPWPLALAPADNFAGRHERGLYLVIDPSTQSWVVRSNPTVSNPTESVGDQGAYTLRDDLNAIVRFTVDFTGCIPTGPEVCNGMDDDCVGGVDDGLPTVSTPVTVACVDSQTECPSTGVSWCENGATTTTCQPAAPPGPVACVDTSGCGRQVQPFCDGGAVMTPQCPPPASTDDDCNGLDDDCDGRVDEDFPATKFVETQAGGTCCTRTLICSSGMETATDCEPVAPSDERPDSVDNDCDGLIDECEAGADDWWCQCSGQDVPFTVTTIVDSFDPAATDAQKEAMIEAAADECAPDGETAGECSLRGLFRWAERLDQLGCRVVGSVPAGVYQLEDELRLGAGQLKLVGADAAPDGCLDPETCVPAATTITTMSPCTTGIYRQDLPNLLDCGCDVQPVAISNHRLINAIAVQRAQPGSNAALTLGLELEDLTLRGARKIGPGSADAGTTLAGGALVMSGGSLVARRVAVLDNRARGLGAGIAVFDADLVRIEDSLIRNNFNVQSVASSGNPAQCLPTGQEGGGMTGAGGGIALNGVTLAEIHRTAIVGNTASDGGGIRARGGRELVVRNSTIHDNHVSGGGGGIWSSVDSSLLFNTITDNQAGWFGGPGTPLCVEQGGGLYQNGGDLSAFGNILAENGASSLNADCALAGCTGTASVVGAGYNLLESTGSGCDAVRDAPNTLTGFSAASDALLGELAVAPATSEAFVRSLGAGSIAIGYYPATPAGGAPPCPDATEGLDQRRYTRSMTQASCSLGAYEADAVLLDLRPSRAVTGIHTGGALIVRDRARVESDITAGTFSIGFDAVAGGALVSLGSGSLNDRASILGSATLGGTLSGYRAGAEGGLVESAPVTVGQLPFHAVVAGAANATVPHDGTSELAPGSYQDVVVRSRGTLGLVSGTYRFASLTFEPDASLNLSGSDPRVVVAVAGTVKFGDRFAVAVNEQSTLENRHLFVYSNGGSVEYGHDATFIGDLEAPAAHVEVRDRAFVRGAIRGASVTLGFDTISGTRAAPAD